MEIFIAVLALVWSILCLILFFKVWGMTNDVKELKNKICGVEKNTDEPKDDIVILEAESGDNPLIGKIVKYKRLGGTFDFKILAINEDGTFKGQEIQTGNIVDSARKDYIVFD